MDKEYLEKCLDKGMSLRNIEKECGLNHRTISYWVKKYDLNNKLKFKKTEKYKFEKIDTKEKAYCLGFILADAYINNSETEIATALKDVEVLEFISSVIGGNVKKSEIFNKETRRFPRARLSRNLDDITKFSGGSKKEDRHFPIIREDLEKYLILGFFDGDGCITWGRRKDKDRIWQKVSFTSQLKMMTGVQKFLIKKLDISTTIKPKTNSKCYVLEFSDKKDVLKFLDYIYSDKDFIILRRKYLKYNALRLELEEFGETTR